jgi:hypothetical protein
LGDTAVPGVEFSHTRKFFSRAVPFFGLIYALPPLFPQSAPIVVFAYTIGSILKLYVGVKFVSWYLQSKATILAALGGTGDIIQSYIFLRLLIPSATDMMFSNDNDNSGSITGHYQLVAILFAVQLTCMYVVSL